MRRKMTVTGTSYSGSREPEGLKEGIGLITLIYCIFRDIKT